MRLLDRLRGAPPLVRALEHTQLAGELEAAQVATLDLTRRIVV
jgi:hypothetical protein